MTETDIEKLKGFNEGARECYGNEDFIEGNQRQWNIYRSFVC